MTPKVIVADEHPIVSAGIQALLRDHDMQVVASTCSVSETLAAINEHQPNVLVMEVRTGGTDALKLLDCLPDSFSPNRVVVFSAHENSSHVARASALGCHDFLMKACSCEQLVKSIKTAATGNPAPENSLLNVTSAKIRRTNCAEESPHPLTNREMQVLRHVSMGLSNREVGKALGISVETVKEHVQNVLRKLKVNDRTQAAVWAVRGGFI
jgi:DNA-binding NarL/FixJ family response regulator